MNKSNKKRKRRLAILLLAIIIPTTVFAAGMAFVPAFRNAVFSIFSSSSTSNKKKPTSARHSTGSGPDGAAGHGENGGLTSETQSQLLADLKAKETGTTYYYVSVLYGKGGSTAGQWNFENKNTSVYQQAVLYECTTTTSYEKQTDGTTKKIVTDTPTTKIGETPIVGPGQHSTNVLWSQPVSGQTRLICAYIHNYNQLNGEYSEGSSFFAQNLTLSIQ